jgi:hypothetical protein
MVQVENEYGSYFLLVFRYLITGKLLSTSSNPNLKKDKNDEKQIDVFG